MPKRIPKWIKQSFVTLVTVLTLGTIVPQVNIHQESKPSKHGQENRRSFDAQDQIQTVLVEPGHDVESINSAEPSSWPEIAASIEDKSQLVEQLSDYAQMEATTQGFEKFGPTISNEIGTTYSNDIVPKFGEVIASLGAEADDHLLKNIDVSHNPAAGTGERILHLYDTRNGEEIIKFHVRRDHPPKDGYWFNFHYHTYKDQFQGHHEIDKVYWDKNTPPQWMS